MAEVPLAACAMHFCSRHPEGPVGCRFDRVRHRRPETRPSRSAVELCLRSEELLTAARTAKNPLAVLRVERARPGALCTVLSQNAELLRRQFCAPILIVLWNVHPANLPDSIDFEGVRFAIVALVVLVSVVALVWSQQRRLIYFPFGHVPRPDTVGLEAAEAVSFPTADGLTLSGWFVSRTETPDFTVMVFNGNAGNRAFRAPLADALARANLAVLLFDYRGFGGNPGSPTEEGLRNDARAARNYLVSRPDVDRRKLVYFGESLGTAVATSLAVDYPPAALILRSPFTSMTDIGRHHYAFLPVRWLLRDRYETIERITRVTSPLMVIAGDNDRIVPFASSRQLYDAANDPKTLLVISGADHNDDSLLAGREMIAGMLRFLRTLPDA